MRIKMSYVVVPACLLILGLALSRFSGFPAQDKAALPSEYCKTYRKEIGPIIEYPFRGGNKGETKKVPSFYEYQTASGYKIRIPVFVGGTMDPPNQQCEMTSAIFSYRWVNGELVKDFDVITGESVREGNLVEIFVWFGAPSKEPYVKRTIPEWKLSNAFAVPGHERILALPFGSYDRPEDLPKDRQDRTKWAPGFLFKDAQDWDSPETIFFCRDLKITQRQELLYVDLTREKGRVGMPCQGYISLNKEASARLDVYGENLLENVAPITRAVVKELNSYIVKD